jgi:CheY-like chemotaxis protein
MRGSSMKRKPFPIVAIAVDDLEERRVLEKAFEECRPDLRIHLFEDSEDLLSFLKKTSKRGDRKDAPDLLVIASQLSEDSRIELIVEVKSHPDMRLIPLVVLSGRSSSEAIEHLYEIGVNTVITKPDDFDELVRVLKTTCDYWFGGIRM